MENEKRRIFPTLPVEMPEIANKFTHLAPLQPCQISHQRVIADRLLQKPSFPLKQGWRCTLATAFELPQRVGSAGKSIRGSHVVKALLTPGHPLTGL